MDAGDCSAVDDKEFWQEIRRLLLSLVCVIERHKLEGPTTSELRKAGKQAIKVDVTEK